MKTFKEFFDTRQNQQQNFEADPNWGDVWPTLVRYYGGDQEKAITAIRNAEQKFGGVQAAKPQILRMLSSITPTGI